MGTKHSKLIERIEEKKIKEKGPIIFYDNGNIGLQSGVWTHCCVPTKTDFIIYTNYKFDILEKEIKRLEDKIEKLII
jgi:hypothetical protein